jgi:hypothetical protein
MGKTSMLKRFSLVLAAAAIFIAGPVQAEMAKHQKVPSKGTTFKKKSGYWTECYYSGLGEVCTTVYARLKTGKLKPATVANTKLIRKQGQVMVCYWGSHNAEVCYWAYSPRKKQ